MKRCRGVCREWRPNEDFPYRGAVGTRYRDVICCRCLGDGQGVPALRREAAGKRAARMEFIAAMLGRAAARKSGR